MNTYQGEGTSPGKKFQSNVITSLIWDFLFSNGDFSSRIISDLFKTVLFIFGEATSSHIFRVTISKQQLLFRSSYFFKTAAFLGSSVFKRVIYLQQLLFQNA